MPTSPFANSASANSASTSLSGGPILFGDPVAGYTTAYIFRVPDPSARGKRRSYALMAISTHREHIAMQVFSYVAAAFRELGAWIQNLAEVELERTTGSPHPDRNPGANKGSNTSPFLTGRRESDSRFVQLGPKEKGLAELVGLPDFFLELHIRFVRLLIEIGLKLNL